YEGQLYLDGQPIAFRNAREAQASGIAIIHQELNLIPYLSVAENVFLGQETTGRCGFIDYSKMHTETSELLQRLNFDIDPATPVSELRLGQQQIVEIAKALSFAARIIIMDEPTSAISDQEVSLLFDLIRALVAKGVAIVYITHKLDQVFAIAHRITVLRDGHVVHSSSLAGLSHDDLVKMMVGREIRRSAGKGHTVADEIVLRVENISLRLAASMDKYMLKDISFSVHAGEILGIFGLMGSGRTELLETVFGLQKKASGEMYIRNRPVEISSPQQAIQAGIGFMPEDRKSDGLLLTMSIAQNISLVNLQQIEKYGFLCTRLEGQLATTFADRLKIKAPTVNEIVENLSGGNQQKVVLAKWLVTDPQVLLLDEPTRGIDINGKNEIYQLIRELAASGLAIVLVSSELPEILAIADRTIVLSCGKIAGEFSREEATEQRLLHAAIRRLSEKLQES
ncbi:sugar ABC transporter ATP-binding protein, partial [candidate division KSB1 bacterium]|nr:sugar ABC transporter ATP-binding protein [candidate division KSB1 bacterium]